MMPHIICLLLIASSPIYTLGDGSGSWGSLSSGPSESECRPYIEKALHGASIQESTHQPPGIDDVGDTGQGEDNIASSEASENVSSETSSDVEVADVSKTEDNEGQQDSVETTETESIEEPTGDTLVQKDSSNESSGEIQKESEEDVPSTEAPTETVEESVEELNDSISNEDAEQQTVPNSDETNETNLDITEEASATESEETTEGTSTEESNQAARENVESAEDKTEIEGSGEATEETGPSEEATSNEDDNSEEKHSTDTITEEESAEIITEETSSEQPKEDQEESEEQRVTSSETVNEPEETLVEDESVQKETEQTETSGETGEESNESSEPTEQIDEKNELTSEDATEGSLEDGTHSEEVTEQDNAVITEPEVHEEPPTEDSSSESDENIKKLENPEERIELPAHDEAPAEEGVTSDSTETVSQEPGETAAEEAKEPEAEVEIKEGQDVTTEGEEATEPPAPEEELSMIIEVPEKLRSREHMAQILRLNEDTVDNELLLSKTIDSTLRDLKKLYDAAIKPLEILYKYRDLSNRHYGDPEIFSKPLILFMGPWSGGKSTIINYLLENEYKKTALRSGAEPSPAYFNIVMWGEREEIMDGTQLAADWTFSGLQKFGQGLLDRLRGLRLNHPLLQKVNIVEIPGILEIRKQVERLFPFNDACQWFIDRADIIFLVYDPSKLDVGPETEAILDQLKGREMQTRIVLNKADQVKPEELMRVQGTLIWNISPLMSSTEPPVMYSTSLWSIPYEVGAPARLLYAQERAFLKDLRDAIDKRVENKIASARRFAVRVRNHAKMVDCYLTTYYNHKSFFGNKKKVSDDIIEHPQNYHIYEGLSTLTNISRYDLPDPDVYRDFFRLNPVYEFQQLASTCTYFRGCPINRLDVAIAYDLPELIGKYKKHAEEVLNTIKK